MQGRASRNVFRLPISLAAIALMLGGCLMGEEKAKDEGDILAENQIYGSVGDGPIIGADLRVMRNDGKVIATANSNELANYGATVQPKAMYYPLTIDARGGTDLVTNLAPDFIMIGVVPAQSDASIANINPFSTLTVEVAREMPDGISEENIAAAQSIVVTVLNHGLTSLVATSPLGTRVDASNIAEMVRASESLSETVRRTRDLQLAFGRPSSGDTVVRALASDLVDGVLDGRGGSRVDPRISALTTVISSQVLLESMQTELHVNDEDATAAMNSAISQASGTTPQRLVDDLRVTPEMLDAVRVGLDASLAVAASAEVQAIRDAIDGVQGGMDPMFIRSLIPSNYRQTLQNAQNVIAGSDDSVIDTINDVARDGDEPAPANRAPNISGTPPTLVVAGANYSFTPGASDPDGDALTFSISGLPSWASFDNATGALSGTPGAGDAGSYGNIVVSVSDGQLSSSLPSFAITVAMNNAAPTISGTPNGTALIGSNYSFTPTASDPDGDTLTFSITGRPLWASFDTSTGRLSGTPGLGDAGTYNGIVISVSDGDMSASLAAFSIDVPTVNTPPSISGAPPSTVTANTAYSFTPTASDPDGDTLTFSVQNLPAWASFASATGRISGTPSAADVGTYTGIRITVTDGADSASLGPFTITVNAVSLGSVTLNWLPPTENADGTALTDLAGYKIYWGTTPGVYPNSVTLNNPGLTSYVVDNLAPGTYEFVAKSFDTAGVESIYSNTATKVVN